MNDILKVSLQNNKALPGMFINAGSTYLARGTYYDKSGEQEAAIEAVVEQLFHLHRDALLVLGLDPRLSEATKTMIVEKAIRDRHGFDGPRVLTPRGERKLLNILLDQVSFTRALRANIGFVNSKINNARTQKMMRMFVGENITAWRAVKYNQKLWRIIRHSLGAQRFGWLQGFNIIPAEQLRDDFGQRSDETIEAIWFLIMRDHDGAESYPWTQQVLRDYYDARHDLDALKRLPMEVATGIAGAFHPEFKVEELYKDAKLSNEQKARVQRAAKARDVVMDISKSSISAKFMAAIAQGDTNALKNLLYVTVTVKAMKNPENTMAIIDVSPSMQGADEQGWRRMATVIETATMSCHDVFFAGDTSRFIEHPGQRKRQDTTLASYVAGMYDNEAIKDSMTVLIFSDGYENDPQGLLQKVTDVITKHRNVNFIHVATVMDASQMHSRWLFGDPAKQLQISKPRNLGLDIQAANLLNTLNTQPWVYYEHLLDEAGLNEEVYLTRFNHNTLTTRN